MMKIKTFGHIFFLAFFLATISLSITITAVPLPVHAFGDGEDGGGDGGDGGGGGDPDAPSGGGQDVYAGDPDPHNAPPGNCSGCVEYSYSCDELYCGDVPPDTYWQPTGEFTDDGREIGEWIYYVPDGGGDESEPDDNEPPPPEEETQIANLKATTMSIPNGYPGQSVNASVTISNAGNATAQNFKVVIEQYNSSSGTITCNNGANDGSQTVSSLGAGQSTTLTIPMNLHGYTTGTSYGVAMVDYECTVSESNENDNTEQTTFTVSTPPPTVDICIEGQDAGCSSCTTGSKDVRWTSSNASSCSVTQTGWTGTSGCQDSGNPTSQQVYTLSCSGSGGTTNDTATLQCVANVGAICTTSANACGMTNAGIVRCDGSCSATSAPSNSSCPSPNVSLSGTSISSCTITWSASPATSCSLVGPGINSSGVSGTVHTPSLSTQASYILTCYNGPEVYTARSRTCMPNPQFQEF